MNAKIAKNLVEDLRKIAKSPPDHILTNTERLVISLCALRIEDIAHDLEIEESTKR